MPDIQLPGRKEFGQLTLRRQSRSMTAKEFNVLSAQERLEIIRLARGRQKYDLLLEAYDGAELVPSMAAQELFLLIKELGREDVGELIGWSSAEQFTTFLDLDIWQGDRLEPAAMLTWLQLLLEAGEEKVCEVAAQLDFELLTLMVKKFVHVSRGPEDDFDQNQGGQSASGYEVEYLDAEGGKVIGAFLDVLSRFDPQMTHNLLRTVRWEQDSLLEEEVFQGRCRRLEEFGFVDPIVAREIFSWLDPASFDPARYRKDTLPLPGEGTVPPGFLLTATPPQDLLAEVLEHGLSREVGWELSYLLNAVISADRIEVGDPAQVQAVLEQVYQCLNLALAHLCGSDVNAAVAMFDQVYLKSLFRLGFSLTLQLQRRAKPLQTSALAPYFETPDRALLSALAGPKPQFYEGLASPGRTGARSFKSLRELQLAAVALSRLELLSGTLTEELAFDFPALEDLDLGGCVPAQRLDLRVSQLFLTALANRLLGRPFLPQPIPATELVGLRQRICEDGVLREDLRRDSIAWLEGLRPGGGALAAGWLALWSEEFCPLTPEQIDPRYLGSLIIRL